MSQNGSKAGETAVSMSIDSFCEKAAVIDGSYLKITLNRVSLILMPYQRRGYPVISDVGDYKSVNHEICTTSDFHWYWNCREHSGRTELMLNAKQQSTLTWKNVVPGYCPQD